MKRILFALLFTALGVVLGIMLSPTVLGQDERTLESAFVKGAMLKISASKARCQQWELRQRKAVCE